MENKEHHLSRGYTKEGKKVVGYAFFHRDRFYLLEHKLLQEEQYQDVEDGNFDPDMINEITSPPQKCLGIRDCEGELIFEGQKIANYYENEKIGTYTVIFIDGCFKIDLRERINAKDYVPLIDFMNAHSFIWKIIHPTNKEQDGK